LAGFSEKLEGFRKDNHSTMRQSVLHFETLGVPVLATFYPQEMLKVYEASVAGDREKVDSMVAGFGELLSTTEEEFASATALWKTDSVEEIAPRRAKLRAMLAVMKGASDRQVLMSSELLAASMEVTVSKTAGEPGPLRDTLEALSKARLSHLVCKWDANVENSIEYSGIAGEAGIAQEHAERCEMMEEDEFKSEALRKADALLQRAQARGNAFQRTTMTTEIEVETTFFEKKSDIVILMPPGVVKEVAQQWVACHHKLIASKKALYKHVVHLQSEMKERRESPAETTRRLPGLSVFISIPSDSTVIAAIKSKAVRLEYAIIEAEAACCEAEIRFLKVAAALWPSSLEKQAMEADFARREQHALKQLRTGQFITKMLQEPNSRIHTAGAALLLKIGIRGSMIRMASALHNWACNRVSHRLARKVAYHGMRLTSKEASIRVFRGIGRYERKARLTVYMRQWNDNRLADVIASSLRLIHRQGVDNLARAKRKACVGFLRRIGRERIVHRQRIAVHTWRYHHTEWTLLEMVGKSSDLVNLRNKLIGSHAVFFSTWRQVTKEGLIRARLEQEDHLRRILRLTTSVTVRRAIHDLQMNMMERRLVVRDAVQTATSSRTALIQFNIMDQDRLDQKRADVESKNATLAYHARAQRYRSIISSKEVEAEKSLIAQTQMESDSYMTMMLEAEKKETAALRRVQGADQEAARLGEELAEARQRCKKVDKKFATKCDDNRALRAEVERLRELLPLRLRQKAIYDFHYIEDTDAITNNARVHRSGNSAAAVGAMVSLLKAAEDAE